MLRPEIRDLAKGRWKGILASLGVASEYLTGKAGACPLCRDGKDRFVFDDKEGAGSWFCRRCGAGDGFDLLMRLRDEDFKSVANAVRAAAGHAEIAKTPSQREWTDAERRKALNELWRSGRPIEDGDVVDRYLKCRGIVLDETPRNLRRIDACAVSRVPGIRTLPAMIAMVSDPEGNAATLHRTYLGEGKKADIDSPRRLMPGPVPRGSAVRLFEVEEGRLGIAEGIETALSAAILYEMPVWAALNAAMLEHFEPPKGISELAIFGDNDASYVGQAAAFCLARRLSASIEVTVNLPTKEGEDFNDALRRSESPARIEQFNTAAGR